jgi:5-formyltetrahydrofolate cyclo-ligase
MNKKELREKYISIRKNITNKEDKSNIIFNSIINDKDYINSKVIGIYKSLSNEVNTDRLIEYSLSIGKVVVLPKIDKDNMNFYLIDNNTKYIKSSFGVEEPISNTVITDIDLFIIPGVVFDKFLNRIGFGKGYYDKYLDNSDSIKIGICFEEQITNSIKTDSNDIKMNKIITDKIIYYDKIK